MATFGVSCACNRVQDNAEYTEVHVNLLQNMAFTQISQWEQLSGNLASVISAEANLTLSSFMMNELASSYQIANSGTENNLSNEYRKMTEFHCQHGIRGHNPDCRMCNWIARSLECTYIDRATCADMRRGYQLTMDAVITPGGLSRELKNIRGQYHPRTSPLGSTYHLPWRDRIF